MSKKRIPACYVKHLWDIVWLEVTERCLIKQYKLPVVIYQPSEETENKYMAEFPFLVVAEPGVILRLKPRKHCAVWPLSSSVPIKNINSAFPGLWKTQLLNLWDPKLLMRLLSICELPRAYPPT
jgi:hypothetical protein